MVPLPKLIPARTASAIATTNVNSEQRGTRSQQRLSELPTVLDDAEARKYLANPPFHGYRGGPDDFKKIRQLHSRYPDLPLWMTEVCSAYEAGTPETTKLPRYDFEDGAQAKGHLGPVP